MTMKKTPLYKTLINSGGRMVPFAGWEMPVQFSSLINEHKAVRENAGLFDISHMGIIELKGKKVKDSFQKLVPSDLYRIGKGESCYTVLLNESGGVIDDLIVYDLGLTDEKEEKLVLVINAACTKKDIDWIKNNINMEAITIKDYKKDKAFIALQGPNSINILQKLTESNLVKIPRFGHKTIQVVNPNLNINENIFISRTGYTGEEGFEMLLSDLAANELWSYLTKESVTPCGLGARDTLRLEAAMHLYGNELNMNTTPFEAGLGWLVHLEMPSHFIGRAVLEKQAKEGISKKLVGIQLEGRAIARKGYKVIKDAKRVGTITSGTWSPSLGIGIALAYLPTELTKPDTFLNIEIRGKEFPAKTVKKPFYRRSRIN